MNKKLMVVAGLTALALTMVMATVAFASGGRPGWNTSGAGVGYGQTYTGTMPMHGDGHGMGMMGAYSDTTHAAMHDDMLTAFAEALDVTRADVDARLAKGETMYDIAIAEGIAAADFGTFMQTTRATALEQAVTDGTLTREQADQMLAHPMGGHGGGHGQNGGRGHNGGRGMGGDTGHCPMHDVTPTATPVP